MRRAEAVSDIHIRALMMSYVLCQPVRRALVSVGDEALSEASTSQRRLTRNLDVVESEMRRMLDPDHGTRAAAMDRALRRLGKRVTVSVGRAA